VWHGSAAGWKIGKQPTRVVGLNSQDARGGRQVVGVLDQRSGALQQGGQRSSSAPAQLGSALCLCVVLCLFVVLHCAAELPIRSRARQSVCTAVEPQVHKCMLLRLAGDRHIIIRLRTL
jgi:hypothetical protein